eukprot:COSAG02_NODE_396_length_23126_cov_282.150258_30_plen_1101_part_00
MDWLSTSGDDSEADGSSAVSNAWEFEERPLGAPALAEFVGVLEANFLEEDATSSCPDDDGQWPLPSEPLQSEEASGRGMLSSAGGLFAPHSSTSSTDSDGSGGSGGSSDSSKQWMAIPHVSTLDIGSLSNPTEFFQRMGPPRHPPIAVDGAVDLVRAHHMDIHLLRPTATAKVTNSPALALSSGADAPTTGSSVPAPRKARSSRTKRSKRIPTGEAAKCPYCAGAVIIDGEVAPELEPQRKKGRFARYRPRVSERKDNRLAAWYLKYGYSGPPYCKSCSESFNSHLLRQNAQAARGSCARENPCEPCKAILGHFSVDADQVYRQFDSRKTARRAKDPKLTSKVKCEVDDKDQLSVSLLSHKRPMKTPGLGKAVTAVAIAFVAATALISMHSFSPDPTQPIANTAKLGWTCGADFSAHFTGTIEALMTIHCAGKDVQTEFECHFDECHEKGLVPVEPRTCRCDGCVRLGRCVGWQLEGHAPLSSTESLAEVCPFPASAASLGEVEGTDPAIHNATGAHQYSWRVPGSIRRSLCSQMCSEHAGCVHFECSGHPQQTQPLSLDPEHPTPRLYNVQVCTTCTLYSAYAWPQPVVSIDVRESTVPEGVVWRTVNGDVWQWVLSTNYWHSDVSFLEEMELDSSGSEDLQYMWRFDSVDRQWQALQSSLKQRPSPRATTTTWHDSTGSLFLFSGQGCGTYGTNPYGYDTYVPGAEPGPPLTLGCYGVAQFADLWRYDTTSLTWQLLRADPAYNGTRLMPRDRGWPRPRERATAWVQEHRHQQRYVAWMFGGAGQTLGYTNENGVGATTELWQYNYSYAESLGSATKDHGKPEQSTSTPVLVNDGHWVLVTIHKTEVQLPTRPRDTSLNAVYECSRKQECPGPRLGAGGWNDPSTRAGAWLFGGVGWSTTTWAEDTALFDLWHFNGDAGKPVWRSIERPPLPTTHGALVRDWPPAWVEPAGWTTSVGGGEIWIAGQSGAQHDVYSYSNAQTPNATHAVVDDKDKFSTNMWVFFIAQGRWAEVLKPLDEHITPLEEGGATVHDPLIPWPGQRQRALVGEGVIFGGVGSQECEVGTWSTRTRSDTIPLTGMWTWIDSASNGHGSEGGGKH